MDDLLQNLLDSENTLDLSIKLDKDMADTNALVFSSLKKLVSLLASNTDDGSLELADNPEVRTPDMYDTEIYENTLDALNEDSDDEINPVLAKLVASSYASCKQSVVSAVLDSEWNRLKSSYKNTTRMITASDTSTANKAMKINNYMDIITPFSEIQSLVTDLRMERNYMHSNMLITALMDFRAALSLNGDTIMKDPRIDSLRKLFISCNTREWGLDRRLISVQAVSTLLGQLSTEYGEGISPLFYFSG